MFICNLKFYIISYGIIVHIPILFNHKKNKWKY